MMLTESDSPSPPPAALWSGSAEALLTALAASPAGLTAGEAAARLTRFGRNVPRPAGRHRTLLLLLRQFGSPIAVLLLVTAALSFAVQENTDAAIILVILLGSGLLGFWQERRAADAVAALLARVRAGTRVCRGGREIEIAVDEVVPGDIVLLAAGDLIPADGRILEATDFDVDEAVLTGESFPVSKSPESAAADAPIGERHAAVFMGTHVASGSARVLVVATGARTLYGALAEHVERRPPGSEFERGVRRFGYLLLEITAVLVLVIFAVNVALHRPVLDVLLVALALAVGLTPQLLPAIVSVTLGHGAQRMARRQVVVKRLVAIEDFGGMTVLCTDKTGTVTEGVMRVHAALGLDGSASEDVYRLAFLNAVFQHGYQNLIDAAITGGQRFDTDGYRKLDEIPYDFTRRRLSVLLQPPAGSPVLITKGAVPEVLAACTMVRGTEGAIEPLAAWRTRIDAVYRAASEVGFRCLGIAFRETGAQRRVTRADETDMVFAGILTLADPTKPAAKESLARLRTLGVQLKMITGDNRFVAAKVAGEIGLDGRALVTGAEVRALSDAALRRRAADVAVFAEIDPNKKERIILALKRRGASVGYVGDGINDAAALHAADVGISVDTAVDVTKQAADIVLLRKDLGVLAEGIAEGRRAFANTLKYVFVTTSASFGNMVSMALVSLVTPFLPMLPKQILLLNLLSDLPAMAIATDRLDPELVARPRRWDVQFIRKFMLTFGLTSSLFDFVTFGLLSWRSPRSSSGPAGSLNRR